MKYTIRGVHMMMGRKAMLQQRHKTLEKGWITEHLDKTSHIRP
jgi:hypothetical protein